MQRLWPPAAFIAIGGDGRDCSMGPVVFDVIARMIPRCWMCR
jgi:hypothetical protein